VSSCTEHIKPALCVRKYGGMYYVTLFFFFLQFDVQDILRIIMHRKSQGGRHMATICRAVCMLLECSGSKSNVVLETGLM
jgi:hypothetical protein